MANSNKKTIIEQYEEIKAILKENGLLTKEKEQFLDKRIEVTVKKNASGSNGEKKLTPTQIANQGIAVAVHEYLATANKALTISQMIKEIPACSDLSNQKINGILTKLYDSEKHPIKNPMFVRTEEKGVAKFSANPDYVTEVEGE